MPHTPTGRDWREDVDQLTIVADPYARSTDTELFTLTPAEAAVTPRRDPEPDTDDLTPRGYTPTLF